MICQVNAKRFPEFLKKRLSSPYSRSGFSRNIPETMTKTVDTEPYKRIIKVANLPINRSCLESSIKTSCCRVKHDHSNDSDNP